MATTATLVGQFNNHLRYLLTETGAGGSATITSAGTATPDLQTDSLAGPIKAISLVKTNGLGSVAAGGVTQAQARAFLMSDATVSVGNADVPRTLIRLTPRTGLTVWFVDCNQSSGDPTIVATASAVAGTAYLDIECPGSIGA